MSEETVALLFESDIVANVDINAAIGHLNSLNRKVTAVAKNISSAFSTLSKLSGQVNLAAMDASGVLEGVEDRLGAVAKRVGEYTYKIEGLKIQQEGLVKVAEEEYNATKKLNAEYLERLEVLSEEKVAMQWRMEALAEQIKQLQGTRTIITRARKEEVEETKQAASEYRHLARAIQLLTKEYNTAAWMSGGKGGTFKVEQLQTLESKLRSLVFQFEEAGEEIGTVRETLINSVEEWVRAEAQAAGRTKEQTEAILKAWRDLFIRLVGGSIIPDLLKAIKKYLIDVMSGIVSQHKDLVLNGLVGIYKDITSTVGNSLKDLGSVLADIGKRAGERLMEGMQNAANAGSQSLVDTMTAIAKKVGDAITSQFKYTMGGLLDILTFKGKEARVGSALDRAMQYGTEAMKERARKEANYYGVALKDAADVTEFQMRVIRESFRDTARNVGSAFGVLVKGQLPLTQSLKGIGIAFDQMSDVGFRNIGMTQKLSAVQSHLARTLGVSTVALSGYRRENEILDKNLNRLATSVDDTSDTMKTQGQMLIKLHDARKRQFTEQMQALAKWVAAYQFAAEVETMSVQDQAKNADKVKKGLADAVAELEKLGIARTVFGNMADDMGALVAEIEKFGTTASVNLTRKFESTFGSATEMFDGLNNEVEKMGKNFPKQLSMFNRAIQDIEGNSKHFLTTLRDGGKISTERLQDLLLAYQNLAKSADELRKTGALADPELARYWENVQRNSLLAIRNFTLMAQRARTVEAVKEKLFGTTKKLTNSIVSLGLAASKHIPIIGKKAQVSAEQMEKFRSATDNVRTSTGGIMFALQGLDPVLGDLTQGMGDMGQQFGAVMQSMKEVAEEDTGSIIKSLTALEITAAAIIGTFTALMIGTAKLAAEVTTLGITMKTVATNVGVPISYAERLVEVLKETGITTREATTAITQWMRAGLAFEWEDPIQKMTYRIDDLARAAQQMAVAMGTDSSEMFARFIDFVQTGNSQLLDSAGIMKNSNQMLDEYAKSIGTVAKALSIRQRQEALIAGLMGESIKLQGVYEEAMKSAGKQLGSMKRYMEELRYEWGKHFEPILAMVVFRFNQLLQYLTDIPEKTKKTITSFITIATAISGLVLGLGFLIPKLKIVLGLFRAFTILLLGKFGLILGLISAVAYLFSKWFMAIEVESDGVQGLVDRLDKILDSFGGLKEVLEPVQRLFKSFFDMFSHHINRIKFLIDEMVGGFSEWFENFKTNNPELISLVEKARKVFGDLFAAIWRVLHLLFGAIEALLSGDWEEFFEKVKLAGRYILAWFLEFFFEVVVTAYEWGKNIISAFAKGLADKAAVIIPQIMTAIGNLLGAFLEGHSPAKIGPLANIDIWGEGIMDAFLKSMAGKRFRFDENMFEGLGSLQAKAKLWGDNIIDVFTYGITGRAAQAIGPAMGYVGKLIAMFLEGHSPPEVGPLSEIMDWGRNAFEQFLAGFEMADFSFLDRALDLIRRRLQLVVEDSQEAGIQLAKAMLAAREFVAGAVSKARATGGPLDLSSMKELILGPLKILAKDVGAVLEAVFDAMKAEAEIKYLEEQIENMVKLRTEAAGLVVDENLLKELQRQLTSANREVSRAQRNLSKLQGEAGRYGVNVLTWEQINAQAQVDLAERRRDEIQDQIDVQEQIQSEIERIRNEVEAQYAEELAAAKASYKAAQERADYLNALLEQRLSYEEELAKANEQLNEKTSNAASAAEEAIGKITDGLENLYDGLTDIAGALDLWGKRGVPEDPPTFSDLWEKYFGDMEGVLGLGDIAHIGLGGFIKVKIEELWDKLVETPVGQWFKGIGSIAAIEEWIKQIGDFLERFSGLGDLLKGAVGGLEAKLGIDLPDLTEVLRWFNWFGQQAAGLLGNLFSMLIPDLLTGLLGGGWGNFMADLEEFTDIVLGWFPSIQLTGQQIWEEVGSWGATLAGYWETLKAGWFESGPGAWWRWIVEVFTPINAFFDSIPSTIANALVGLWDAITKPFIDIRDFLIGNSLIPDLINSIVSWIGGLPEKILAFAQSILDAALTLGLQIWTGFWTKIQEVVNNIGLWFDSIIENILLKAEGFWNAAWEVARNIYSAIYDVIFNEETGIVAKIGGWIQSIVDIVVGFAQTFYDAAYDIGEGIINGIKDAIDKLKSGLTGIVKSLWNDGLRKGFNTVLKGIAGAINKVIDILNSAASVLPFEIPGFPIGHVSAPVLPELATGGIITQDIVAQLHAGEVVLPLDRLEGIMRSLNITQPPIFAPTMNFFPGTSPQQIIPAVEYAGSLYEERMRSGT